MNTERETSRNRITLDPELLFFLPILGYGLAYAYEYGAFATAKVPATFIQVSVAQIVTACGVVFVPLLAALFASASSSTRLLERGWAGFFLSVAFPAVGYLPIFIAGLLTGNATYFYLGAGSLAAYVVVTSLFFWPRSPVLADFVMQFHPQVRKAFAVLFSGVLVCALGMAGGAIQEHSKELVQVIDTECGAYSRVFRMNGDVMLVIPPTQADSYVAELWSLSSRGTVRVKRATIDEYASRQLIAGPCQFVKKA